MSAYGSLGNIYGLAPDQLPEWLRRQYLTQDAGGESGGTSAGFLNGLKDQQGRSIVQLGSTPEETKGENGTLIDPSKAWFDPDLGWVTTPENFKGAEPPSLLRDPLFQAFAGIAGVGLGLSGGLGEIFGGGDAFAGAQGAGEVGGGLPDSYWSQLASNAGASDAGGEGLAGLQGGDLPFGTEMPNTYAPGADPTASFGIGDSYYTPGLGQGLNSPSLLDRILGPLANPSDLPQWIMDHPLDAMRMGLGAGSLISALTQGRGSSGGLSGGMPWTNGPIPSFNPQQGQFQQNPYLNYQVPFMPGGF